MVRRHCAALLAFPVLLMLLTGCGPNVRSEAEQVIDDHVNSSVQGMRLTLVAAQSGSGADPSAFAVMAEVILLDGLEVPASAPRSTLFCLEQHDDEIDACMFYPALVRVQAGLSDTESNLYGCARLTGSLGSASITAEDMPCPEELIGWAKDAVVLDPPQAVSIVDIAGQEFKEEP